MVKKWNEFIKGELEYFRVHLPKFLCDDEKVRCKAQKLEKVLAKNEKDITVQPKMLKIATKLIKIILADSIKYLSENGFEKDRQAPYRRTIDNVNEYIDSFVNLEEYLFGIDFRYRDHLLHSLWVYLLGHRFIRESVGYDKMRIMAQGYLQGEGYLSIQERGRLEDSLKYKGKLKRDPYFLTSYFEAMWGMIALLHDFGYPIEKIGSDFPQQISDTFKKFGVDFRSMLQVDVGSGVALLYEPVSEIISAGTRPKGLTDGESNLIGRIAKDKEWWSESGDEEAVRITYVKDGKERAYYYNPNRRITEIEKAIYNPILKNLKTNDKKETLYILRPTEIKKVEEQEYEFRIAFALKKHPAWSAIYAFSQIAYLHAGSRLLGGGHDYLHLLTVKDILYSIVHHSHESPMDYLINRFSFILLLMDEIEEIGRYSKGGEPRGGELSRCKMEWNVTENHK